MVLLDTNIVIYVLSTRSPELAARVLAQDVAVNWVVRIETLGWHHLAEDDRRRFERFFDAITTLPMDEAVYTETIRLRKAHRVQLPDALVAATAIRHDVELWTANMEDFEHISGLKVSCPV